MIDELSKAQSEAGKAESTDSVASEPASVKPADDKSAALKPMAAKPAVAKGRSKKKLAATNLNKWIRLAIQLVFLVLAPQVFSMAFAGAKYLVVCISKGQLIEATSFVALLLGLCISVVVLGRFFCGFICGFGAFGDIVYQLVHAVLAKLGVKKLRIPEKFESKLRYVKYLVLVAVLVAVFAGANEAINVYSPWTAWGRLINLNGMMMTVVGTMLLLLIVVGMALKERFFCQFLCPLGALFSLLPQLPFARVQRHMDTCVGCSRCKRACPVSIYPPNGGPEMGECINCGRCESLCPTACIAQMGLTRLEECVNDQGIEVEKIEVPAEGDKPARTKTKIRSTKTSVPELQMSRVKKRVLRSVVQAVAFLIFFWLVGAVNYLPNLGLF